MTQSQKKHTDMKNVREVKIDKRKRKKPNTVRFFVPTFAVAEIE